MLRMLISPNTTPSASVANTVDPSSEMIPIVTVPVVRDDREFASLDDVQLFADVTLATDIVSRTEHSQTQLQYQLDQQARLTLLEDGHAPQRLQVNLRKIA